VTVRWSDVEPVLQTTYRLLADRDFVSSDEVIAALDPAPADAFTTGRALRELAEHGYIDGAMYLGHEMPENIRATEKGLQAASGWPVAGESQVFATEFVKVLTERINDAETPEDERGKLRKLRDATEDLGVKVVAEVLARMAEHKGL
jgi:hypothetical protein